MLLLLFLSLLAQHSWTQEPLPSPVFYKTLDSNEWVSHSIHVQKKYSRVLLVDASDRPPGRIKVLALDLNATRPAQTPSTRSYKVQVVFKTLQEAADAARGGDLVAVMSGTYAGFVVEDKPSVGEWRYIHFKAMGQPGDVIINRASPNRDWMILLRATHHIIIEGFNIAGHNMPGIDHKSARWNYARP